MKRLAYGIWVDGDSVEFTKEDLEKQAKHFLRRRGALDNLEHECNVLRAVGYALQGLERSAVLDQLVEYDLPNVRKVLEKSVCNIMDYIARLEYSLEEEDQVYKWEEIRGSTEEERSES